MQLGRAEPTSEKSPRGPERPAGGGGRRRDFRWGLVRPGESAQAGSGPRGSCGCGCGVGPARRGCGAEAAELSARRLKPIHCC